MKDKMLRIATACFLGWSSTVPLAAQSTTPSSDKPATNCTTSRSETSASTDEKTSMAIGKSAILPSAGGSSSAAPTVQSGGKPMVAGSECPPDSKPK